jgi:hypothetical protein
MNTQSGGLRREFVRRSSVVRLDTLGLILVILIYSKQRKLKYTFATNPLYHVQIIAKLTFGRKGKIF